MRKLTLARPGQPLDLIASRSEPAAPAPAGAEQRRARAGGSLPPLSASEGERSSRTSKQRSASALLRGPWLRGPWLRGPWLAAALLACRTPEPAPVPQSGDHRHPKETHFGDLLQLTDGGENAEAYWSFDGSHLILQAHEGEGCDQIYTMPVSGPLPERTLVSTGKGTTTCAYFLPGDEEIVYSSTHLGGDACPPKPDHSKGYVWPLYSDFEIFRANRDGSNVRPLTQQEGYDAEATICSQDGSIIFTSTRDGDLELYRMDSDGNNVQRLTHTPGYDGGAFFSQDCSKIVWRASRPTGSELADYQQLLAEGLVRPSKLELFVANADGSDARQVTYLNAAAFGPFFTPNADRILFSTNFNDPKGREFDIWAVNVDGSGLEQITHTPGFDGFPMFSPDGKHLAFASNRASRPGTYDTNVFIAQWVDHPPETTSPSAADRVRDDVQWLAAPERQGRGVGTQGLETAGQFIEDRMASLGLEPAGNEGSYRQPLEVVASVKSGPKTSLQIAGKAQAPGEFQPLGFSAGARVEAPLVLAGYGIRDEELGVDDYAGVNAKGKIVVVRRFVPEGKAFADTRVQRRLGDLRYKAWTAREQGAKGLIVVDAPLAPADAPADWKAPAEAAFPALLRQSYGDAGMPVVIAKRQALQAIVEGLAQGRKAQATLEVDLQLQHTPVFNVLGRLPANAPSPLPGSVLVGAHYDHLGFGGAGSLAPDDNSAHLGADDNASGVAAMLEVARLLQSSEQRPRDVVFAAFTAEEMGILGSAHLVKNPPRGLSVDDLYAMVNFDMVGRLRDNKVSILGAETAAEWKDLLPAVCDSAAVQCALSGSGYGPSDQSSFYAAGVPVLHFFTGAHSEYHKPSDHPSLINAGGAARIAQIAAQLVGADTQPKSLTYKTVAPEEPTGDLRSFNASLGTIPDYAGSPGKKGMLLAGVRPGSGADLGGLQRGDLLIQLGKRSIEGVHDLMFALNAAKPGETVTALVVRGGQRKALKVTYQERRGGRRASGAAQGGAAPQGAHGGAAPQGAHGGAAPQGAHGGSQPAGSAHGARPAGERQATGQAPH